MTLKQDFYCDFIFVVAIRDGVMGMNEIFNFRRSGPLWFKIYEAIICMSKEATGLRLKKPL